jgi:DNA replication protein DnaC
MSSLFTELNSQLHSLKLPTMAESFSEIALKAARNGLSHEAYLHELVRLEWEAREQRRRARLLSESGLPREKTFRTLQLGAFPPLIRQQIERLRSGAFVQQAVNVVVVGKPGAGKSHLLASLGHALVEQGYPVLWRSTAHLMQRLLAAKRDLRLPQELAKLDRYACLILDDIGYVQHDQDEMEILFTLLSERYERKTVMISTNLVFSEWTRIFKSPMTTMAAIDRVVHHCVIVDMMAVDSYRAKEATITSQQATTILPDAGASSSTNKQEISPVTSENGTH